MPTTQMTSLSHGLAVSQCWPAAPGTKQVPPLPKIAGDRHEEVPEPGVALLHVCPTDARGAQAKEPPVLTQ